MSVARLLRSIWCHLSWRGDCRECVSRGLTAAWHESRGEYVQAAIAEGRLREHRDSHPTAARGVS